MPPVNKIYRNEQRSNDIQVWLLSFNIGDYIWWLYSKFVACMLTQINWVNTYGTVSLIRCYIVRHYVITQLKDYLILIIELVIRIL